jgi:efflux transporter, outer membrane factor (OMF) lipoprotein, NodT family
MSFPLRPALIALVAITMATGGCSMAPKYVAPAPPVPESWPVGDAYLVQSEAGLPIVSYKDIFEDPGLQVLIEQALVNNRDLRIAAANVAAARAQTRVVRAAQLPEVGVSASAAHTERGGGNQAVLQRGGWTYNVQGGISSFELDLFGRLANATQSQRNTALATEASARTVRLSLVADLALAWATYAADNDLLEVAQSTAANAEESLRLITARLRGGVAPRTDLRQAEQVLETARGDVAVQRAALAQDINAIRLLVGADFDKTLLPQSTVRVNDTLGVLPAGTSSQVLLRRPDVIAAEYDLKAANADIGVARAQLFPTLSLTGLLGFASTSLSTLLKDDSFTASKRGDASWSIFNAGGRSASVEVAKAQRDAALAAYEGAIQTAFREVSDALADQGTLAERLRATTAFTSSAQDAARLTEATYRQGIASSLDNLDAQRSLYTARRSEVVVRLQVAANRITLYRVLGGDQTSPVQE